MTDFKERCKGIILAYFIHNKGEWVSASQLADHLSNNNFRLGRYRDRINSNMVASMLNLSTFNHIEKKNRTGRGKVYRYVND